MPHEQPSLRKRPLKLLALVCMAAVLSGCAELHHGAEAVGRMSAAPASDAVPLADATPMRTDVKTVRPRGTSGPHVSASEPVTVVQVAAVPSPRQIFDFHANGNGPNSYHQPFLIDPNDGPLAADVRRSTAELRAFNADAASRSAGAGPKRCSEADVAQRKPGCTGTTPTATSTVSRSPLSLQ